MTKILVVEDDASVLDLVKTILEGENYTVLTAPSAEYAKKVLQEENPDLALIDIMLPGQGGMDLILDLHSTNPGLTIIIMSGKIDMTMSTFKVLAHQFGVVAILPKPFTVDELLTTITGALVGQIPT